MARFIKTTIDGTNDTIHINADQVTHIVQHQRYTAVSFDDGMTICIPMTADDFVARAKALESP
jgi:hypothetical protein